MKKSLLKYGFIAVMFSLAFSSCNNGSSDNSGSSPAESDDTVFALVNIPYAEFFKSETTDGNFDAYTSPTQKVANGAMSYGTYHEATAELKDAVAKGITCPVKISKAVLESLGGTEITDESSSFDLTITGRGASTIRYSGKQNLFQSKDYSYYILDEAPAYYKEASKQNDKVVFGKIISNPKDIGTLYVTIAAGEAHHDFSPTISFYTSEEELSAEKTSITVKKLSQDFEGAEVAKKVTKNENEEEVLTDQPLSALKTIIATDSEGKEYGLTTLSNFFWGKKQMGFKAPKDETNPEKSYYPQHELIGKTITKLTFVTESDIYTCSKIVKGSVEDAKAAETTFTPTADGSFVVDNIQAK